MPAFSGNIAKNRLWDLHVYSYLSNCSDGIFVEVILLEIGFISSIWPALPDHIIH